MIAGDPSVERPDVRVDGRRGGPDWQLRRLSLAMPDVSRKQGGVGVTARNDGVGAGSCSGRDGKRAS